MRRAAGLVALAVAAAGADLRVVQAVKSGDVEGLRSLIAQHADVNASQPGGLTALHLAVQANDEAMAKLLLGGGANPNAVDRYGTTPLHLAATNGSAGMIEALMRAGANPNAALPEGETALMTASRTGDAASVKALLAHGADANAKEHTFGETALMWAAAENHPEAVEALIAGGADKNARSTVLHLTPFQWVTSGMVSTTLPRGGWTALMYAARQNSMAAARTLAEKGADLNLADPDGTTALVFAIINAHFDLAAMLLEKGADPNIADETGMAALYAAVDMHTLGPMISRPAPKLVDDLDAEALVKRLLAHGANPNARLKRPVIGRHHDGGDASLGEGTTPLMRATKANDVEVMKLLLDAGASPFLTQKDYTTPLMIAAAGGARAGAYSAALSVTEAGTIEAMKLLIDHGADVNSFNANGQTALHRAAQRGADQVVRFLAEHGAKLDFKDKQGRMPVDVAREPTRNAGAASGPGHESTAALLRQLMQGAK
ncbi:MAG TPA: ankyrin repeat domain-containing protein [Bryobacteraceae bacterium]|nr:ankyrin repeat domain-containing protein [Bryobacteraceae bacterium]